MISAAQDEKPRRSAKLSRDVPKLAYTREEAAAATGVSLNHIREAVSTRDLPATKKGREWIILASDLLEWLKR